MGDVKVGLGCVRGKWRIYIEIDGVSFTSTDEITTKEQAAQKISQAFPHMKASLLASILANATIKE